MLAPWQYEHHIQHCRCQTNSKPKSAAQSSAAPRPKCERDSPVLAVPIAELNKHLPTGALRRPYRNRFEVRWVLALRRDDYYLLDRLRAVGDIHRRSGCASTLKYRMLAFFSITTFPTPILRDNWTLWRLRSNWQFHRRLLDVLGGAPGSRIRKMSA